MPKLQNQNHSRQAPWMWEQNKHKETVSLVKQDLTKNWDFFFFFNNMGKD